MSAYDPKRTLPLHSVASSGVLIRLGTMRSGGLTLGGGKFSAFYARRGLPRAVMSQIWATNCKSLDSCYAPDGTCGMGSIKAVL